MHELSLCNAIVDAVVKHAGGRPVTTVNLRVGRLRQVMPESLEFYFGFVAEGTVCEGACLEQEILPAKLGCSACGHQWEPEWPLFLCPSCDGMQVTVLSGDEFEVESIEIKEATDASPGNRSA